MKEDGQDIVDRAIAWHLRLDSASGEEWHRFILWLEADQAHRDAYDRIEMDDALLIVPPAAAPIAAVPIAANDARKPRRIGLWAAGGSIGVAALLAAMLIPGEMASDGFYTIETAPGTTRTVTMADGTSIEMNGGTRLRFRHGDNRFAALDSGEATFHIRHDPAHPFELKSGKFAVRDLGTIFNVTRDGPRLGVDVAQGSVLFQPGQQAVTLTSGMGLSIHDEQAQPAMRKVRADSVGGWRRGVFNFRDAPVRSVVEAVGRSTGAHIRFDDKIGNRRVTGTVHLTDSADVVIPRVAALIGADWKYDRGAWMLTMRSDEKQ